MSSRVTPDAPRQRKKHGAAKLRLRFRVLERDNFRCHWCGVPARETRIVIDHVMPFSKGGVDDPSNYVASCEPCNGGKGDLILEPRDDDPIANEPQFYPFDVELKTLQGLYSAESPPNGKPCASLTLLDGKTRVYLNSTDAPSFIAALRRAADEIEAAL
jgi:hypothetical protein